MLFRLLFLVFINLFSISTLVTADIVLDGTLGRSGALQGPDFAIGAELGQQYGGNLFHSFHQFNLYPGETATFSGQNTVNNVISRVTGGETSNINGLLRSTIPNAAVYFLNPAGVMFGEHAQLDVLGSFYVSSADYLRLEDGGQFHASQPENSLLTIAPPTAFGFLEPKPALISAQGSQLSVPATQTLSLTCGDINLTQSGLHAPAGQIHLASVASAGEVKVNPKLAQLDSLAKLGQIKLSQSTLGNAVYEFDGAQSIYIRGGQFWAQDSVLNAKVKNPREEASQITIASREAVDLQQDAVIATDSFGTTDAGDIMIDTHQLIIRDNAMLSSDTQRGGTAGILTIQADHITITDDAKISSSTSNQGGASGLIRINADIIQMMDKTQLKATSRSTPQPAGQIVIVAEQLQMTEDATIDTIAFADANGDGGSINIKANTLVMTDQAWIISSSFNSGHSGAIHIQTNTLSLSGESAIVGTTFNQGKGGNITISVQDTLSIKDAAVVSSGTEGQGSGGTVILALSADKITMTDATNINSASGAKNVVTAEIARILTLAEQLGSKVDVSILNQGGKPGNVYIYTDHFSLENRAVKPLPESLQLENCENPSVEKGYFKSGRHKGLDEAFHDM